MNEDAAGYCVNGEEVLAAWVLDGVSGINTQYLLDVPSEAAWLVQSAHRILQENVPGASDVLAVLDRLAGQLELLWIERLDGRAVPENYDLPAACLSLVMRVQGGWQTLRLGDSYVLSRSQTVINHPFPPSNLPDLEAELRREAALLRQRGTGSFETLRTAFSERLQASRRRRNEPGSYSILVPHPSARAMPQTFDIGTPDEILLCTDGYYRAVDTYGLFADDDALMQASAGPGGVDEVLRSIRTVEENDPDCVACPRFKPADDVSAVLLNAV